MSLDLALKRLSLRPSGLCQQCRRAFASSSRQPQQQSAAGQMADSIAASRAQASVQASRPTRSIPSEHTTASRPDSASAQRTAFGIAESAIKEMEQGKSKREDEQRQRDMASPYGNRDYEQQSTRRWAAGDVYAPHDLSGVEMAKWKKQRRKGGATGRVKWDAMDQLGMDPREYYKNFSIMSEYMTDMGRIKHRNETGLRPVNQRRMAKAIRRAIGMGLMPGVHRHPEILRLEMEARNANKGPGR